MIEPAMIGARARWGLRQVKRVADDLRERRNALMRVMWSGL
jgi:hypothetical protein